MWKELPVIIEGKAYPKAAGAQFGYRCCIGGEWFDCDEKGNVTGNQFAKKKAW